MGNARSTIGANAPGNRTAPAPVATSASPLPTGSSSKPGSARTSVPNGSQLAPQIPSALHHPRDHYRHVWDDRRRGGSLHRHLRCAQKKRRKRYGHYDSRGRLAGKKPIEELSDASVLSPSTTGPSSMATKRSRPPPTLTSSSPHPRPASLAFPRPTVTPSPRGSITDQGKDSASNPRRVLPPQLTP